MWTEMKNGIHDGPMGYIVQLSLMETGICNLHDVAWFGRGTFIVTESYP